MDTKTAEAYIACVRDFRLVPPRWQEVTLHFVSKVRQAPVANMSISPRAVLDSGS